MSLVVGGQDLEVFEAISKKYGGFSRSYEDLTRSWLNTVISGAQGRDLSTWLQKQNSHCCEVSGGRKLPVCYFSRSMGEHYTNSYKTPWVLDVAEIGDGQTCVMMGSPIRKPRVCILGGGFGGLYTALRLESLVWPDERKPQVLLVDQSECFVFKPMLYELLSGEVDSWEIAPRFSELLENTSVQFFQDRVKVLRPSDHIGMNGPTRIGCGGTVHLESGLLVEYDWLVLALGAESKLDVVPGAKEFALPFSTLEDAYLRTLERTNFAKESPIRVTVVGCGYCGVELAATVSERLRDRGVVQAINVESIILPNAPPGNREFASKAPQANLCTQYIRCKLGKAKELPELS
ncbi:hypothetical protein RJ639_010050 [Escallonia herrerae]|uniref:FAD/NAD(P)-binding domain-containing protein n=1 Tax=Escallonia herrerae TaxID=1293975 RepID=A0AA89AVU7_9ASTE|nr:hypothetical protein RJ639_010050 [Escallonia herrerae]